MRAGLLKRTVAQIRAVDGVSRSIRARDIFGLAVSSSKSSPVSFAQAVRLPVFPSLPLSAGCAQEVPKVREIRDQRLVACHFAEELDLGGALEDDLIAKLGELDSTPQACLSYRSVNVAGQRRPRHQLPVRRNP